MFRFYFLRIIKDYIGHIILIGLPVVLISLMVMINQEASEAPNVSEMALFIGIIYIIMFQGFGAAYTFEGIEFDFFKPFKDRLKAAPVNPMMFVFMNILFSILISFMQSLFLLVFVVTVYGSVISNVIGVLFVLFLGVLLAQLLAAVCVLVFKKASKAQAFITLYIIASMVVAGFFFPLPKSSLTVFLSKYSSPLAWTHYAVYGFLNDRFNEALFGISLLLGVIIILSFLTYRLSKKVAR